MKKRIAAAGLAAIMALTMIGCGQTATDSEREPAYEKTSMETVGGDTIEVEHNDTPLPMPETETEAYDWSEEVHAVMDEMTLEEKVAQMFVITPEALTGYNVVTAAKDSTKSMYETYPVGGFVYYAQNVDGPEQLYGMTYNTQQIVKERIGLSAFICIDEEGGEVAKLGAKAEQFDIPRIGSMRSIGDAGDTNEAYKAGEAIGEYLHYYGINVDFAPVADVVSNENNEYLQNRSFGTDPVFASGMVVSAWMGLRDEKVVGVLKHFPGQGAAIDDPAIVGAYTDKSLDEMMENEMLPFIEGIKAGVDMIMASNMACPTITGDNTPASLSKTMLTDVLRGQLGFNGVIITAPLTDAAVALEYSSTDAAVQAILAGADILLSPQDFQSAYQGVLNAIAEGQITEERINESVFRIIKVKLDKIESKKKVKG